MVLHGSRAAIAQPWFTPIHGERRDHFCVAADGDHHRAITRFERAEKRLGRLLRQAERIARHAPAPIDAERHGEGKFTGGERGHLLELIVLVDLEIPAAQPGHRLALGAGDGGIDLDELYLG